MLTALYPPEFDHAMGAARRVRNVPVPSAYGSADDEAP